MAVIGDLVAKLTADTRQFETGMASARTTVADVVSSIGKMSVATAAALGATVMAVRKLSSSLGGAFDAADQQIQSEQKLASVIKATGKAAGIGQQGLLDYAGELERITNFSAGESIDAMAKLLTFKDLEGDTFKRVLEGAQDITAVFGGDLSENVQKFALAIDDPIKGLGALSKQGFKFTDEQKRMMAQMVRTGDIAGAQAIIFEELEGQVGGAAQGMASPFKQFQNTLDSVSANVGMVLRPMMTELANAAKGIIGPVADGRSMFDQFGETLGEITRETIAPAVTWLADLAKEAMSMGDTFAKVFRNLGDYAQIAVIDAKLALVELIPASNEAWSEVAATIGGVWEGAKAAFTAFLQNIKAGLQELVQFWAAYASGIIEAFGAIKRGENPVEAGWNRFVETLANQKDIVGGGNPFEVFNEAFERTRSELRDIYAEEGGFANSLRKQRDELLRGIEMKEALRLKVDAEDAVEAVAGGLENELGGFIPKLAGAVEMGSTDALSAINREMFRGDQKEPIEKVAQTAEQQLAEQRAMERHLAELARQRRPIVFQV